MRRLAALLAIGLVTGACSKDDEPTSPDAGGLPSDDDGGSGFAACAEFSAAPVVVPATVESAVEGADVTSPLECAQINAPYGAESAGPDRVIPLVGLRVDTAYMVKLTSPEDLGFYIVSGCNTETGPASDQCLVFEDSSLGGVEAARFVATQPQAYVVVDFYASHDPESPQFELEIYAEECSSATQCGAATPACVHGRCVECETSFDCEAGAESRCDEETFSCEAGIDSCQSDDASEPADDGPAGARVLAVPPYGGSTTVTGKICSSPFAEDDYFAFDVTALGDTWDFTLGWTGTRDLDLKIYDAAGEPLGLSFWEQSERVRLTYLPRGRYYVEVDEFATEPDAAPVTYTLQAQRTSGAACTYDGQCAAEYRNQILRGDCSAGACIPLEGAGAVTSGGACDSESDCLDALACSALLFTANADTRATCSPTCADDAECGPGSVCTTYFNENFCIPKCTIDDHCPTSLVDDPETPPWFRLSCDVQSGRCM